MQLQKFSSLNNLGIAIDNYEAIMQLFLTVGLLVVSTVSSFQLSKHSGALRSNTRLYDLKFDPSNFIRVSLMKPLGLQLEEVKKNGKSKILNVGD